MPSHRPSRTCPQLPGRYTHRVAISNHRLVSFNDGHVSFRWKDYAAGSKQKLMINPVTKTNWEGVGVKPDVPVPADQALDKAELLARTRSGS